MADKLFHLAPSLSDFDRWLSVARRAAQVGQTHGALLGGLPARLHTNQPEAARAWQDLFSASSDQPPPQPAMSLYAVAVEGHEPLTAIHLVQSVAVMINRTEREALLDAVASLAANALARQTALVVRGTCVEAIGNATLVTGPRHASVAAQLGQVAIGDLVLIRITLTRQVDGVQLAPTGILTERGQEINGAAMWQWLRDDAYQEPRADVFCLSLDGRDEPVMARDLDLDRCPEPYAYALTQARPRSMPSLVSDAVMLAGEALLKLSSDFSTFAAQLVADQPWLPQGVTREVMRAISRAKSEGCTNP